jgi:hypothetical protein
MYTIAIISITGGSFSTVGDMVKLWREEQAAHSAPLLQMPDSVTNAMHKAAFDIWAFTVTFLLSACSCSHAALTALCVP